MSKSKIVLSPSINALEFSKVGMSKREVALDAYIEYLYGNRPISIKLYYEIYPHSQGDIRIYWNEGMYIYLN